MNHRRTIIGAVAVMLLVRASAAAPVSVGSPLLWTPVPNQMSDSRWAPSAIVLADGARALVAGGYSYDTGACVSTADIYDESDGRFHRTAGRLTYPRDFANANTLPAGRVLITGGYNTILGSLPTAEVYDPKVDQFTVLDSQMSNPRELFTATTLADGRVLVAGGFDTGIGMTQTSADLFDPSTMQFTRLAGGLKHDRFGHTAVLLKDGRVLIVGGKHWYEGDPDRPLASAEIFDPTSMQFHETAGLMSFPRDRPSATLLPDGTVFIAGGQNGGKGPVACELFDPSTETFHVVAATLQTGRMAHGAALLPNGNVVVAGGWSPHLSTTTATTEIYTPSPPSFTSGPLLPVDVHDFAFLEFPDGLILAAGGKQVEHGGQAASLASGAVWRP